MCDIISINKDGELSEKDLDTLMQTILAKQESNGDASSVLAFNYDNNKVKRIREYRISREVIVKLLEDYDSVNFHFRIRTSGDSTKNNCHFWRKGDWFFAHNGSSRDDIKEKSVYCDSYHLFARMIKDGILLDSGYIDIEKGKELLKEFSFWGRFMVYNKRLKRTYYFGDFETYPVNSHLVLASSTLYYDIEAKAFNMKFTENRERISRASKKIDGIHFFNLKYGNMVQLLEPVKKSYYYNNNYGYNDYDRYQEEKSDKKIQQDFNKTFKLSGETDEVEEIKVEDIDSATKDTIDDAEWYDAGEEIKKKKSELEKQKIRDEIDDGILEAEITVIVRGELEEKGVIFSEEDLEDEVTRILNEGLK